MSLFRSMMSVNFRVNEKGETTFFFPVVGGVVCARNGYRITSDEDVTKLKRYLRIHLGVALYGIVPLLAVLGVAIQETIVGFRIVVFLLFCLLVVVAFTVMFDRVLIRKVVGKYERIEDKPRFRDLQRIQAESCSWKTFVLLGLLHLLFVAVGLYAVLSSTAVAPGIVIVIVFALTGGQLGYQLVLKRQGGAASGRK